MVMMGALIAATGLVSRENLKNSIPEVVSARNIRYNEINLRAIDMGYEYIKGQMTG
jgi:Pyruvate/2-oxoacid:ferredoxin oxidoreductase gamma subunit